MEWLILLGGLAVLIIGGELLVKGAVGIAVKLNISMLVVGLTVVAFGTSAPELFISLTAAITGHAGISIGNIVGSNIYNISLILGVACLIFPITPEKQSIRFDWPVMIGASMLLFLFLLNGALERYEGIILFLLLVAFIWYLISKSRKENVAVETDVKPNLPKDIALVLLGSLALMFGADWFLDGAVVISKHFGLSDQVIGLTIVALGTSMPELATSVMASLKKRTDISIGNLIGSNIFNVLAVGGLTATVKPIVIDNVDGLFNNLLWMLAISLLIFPLMYFGNKIGRLKAILLLLVFSLYTFLLLN